MIQTMTITRALAELKLYDDKIEDKISSSTFIAANKKSNKKINQTYTKEEFATKVKASLDSITDMINRRNKIKELIVASNATTIVEIAGVKMTVAKAIERKNSIKYEKMLLTNLRSQYNSCTMKVNNENLRVQDGLNTLLNSMLSKEGRQKASEEEINNISSPYLNLNEYELVNPLEIHKIIEKLENEIEKFELEVDYVLSESNTITKIEIDDNKSVENA